MPPSAMTRRDLLHATGGAAVASAAGWDPTTAALHSIDLEP